MARRERQCDTSKNCQDPIFLTAHMELAPIAVALNVIFFVIAIVIIIVIVVIVVVVVVVVVATACDSKWL